MTAIAADVARLVARGPTCGPFWITRDSDSEGRPDDYVDVWASKPNRVRLFDGAFWIGGGGVRSRIARVAPDIVRRWVSATGATVPETDRECVRVG